MLARISAMLVRYITSGLCTAVSLFVVHEEKKLLSPLVRELEGYDNTNLLYITMNFS